MQMLSPEYRGAIHELCLARQVSDTLIRDVDAPTRFRISRAFAQEAFHIMLSAGADIIEECKLLEAKSEQQMSALILAENDAFMALV